MALQLRVEDLGEEGCVGGGDGEGWRCGGGDESIKMWKVGVQDVDCAGEKGECFGVRG